MDVHFRSNRFYYRFGRIIRLTRNNYFQMGLLFVVFWGFILYSLLR